MIINNKPDKLMKKKTIVYRHKMLKLNVLLYPPYKKSYKNVFVEILFIIRAFL